MNKLQIILTNFIMIILLFIVSCAPKEKLQTTVGPTPRIVSPSISSWENKWERTLTEARKERRVVISATSMAAPVRELITTSFKNKFGVDAEFVFEQGALAAQRISQERKGGVFSVDVAWAGASTMLLNFNPAGFLDELEPALILPEVLDNKVWLGGKLAWNDTEHKTLAFGAALQPIVLINTNLVNSEEIKSINDVLKPKWKGKIILADPTVPGSGSNEMMGLGTGQQGWDFLHAFLKQEPIITRDVRQMTEWVAREKYSIAMGTGTAITRSFQEAGAPIKNIVPPDSAFLSAWGSSLAIMQNAHHPNASKLFVNWLLSREAQLLISKPYNTPSARIDIPNKELVDPAIVPDTSVKYRNIDETEWISRRNEHQKKVSDIFIPYMNMMK